MRQHIANLIRDAGGLRVEKLKDGCEEMKFGLQEASLTAARLSLGALSTSCQAQGGGEIEAYEEPRWIVGEVFETAALGG